MMIIMSTFFADNALHTIICILCKLIKIHIDAAVLGVGGKTPLELC